MTQKKIEYDLCGEGVGWVDWSLLPLPQGDEAGLRVQVPEVNTTQTRVLGHHAHLRAVATVDLENIMTSENIFGNPFKV